MACGACGKALPEATARRRFCGPACRGRHWRVERERVMAEALDQAERALERARGALARKEGKR